jgi:dolichol-phosphate mannosyltransferase
MVSCGMVTMVPAVKSIEPRTDERIGRVYIGLPAHNEEVALPRLLHRIERLGASLQTTITVVLYNDGSTDSTSTIARQWQKRLSLVLLDCPQNKGLGAGLRALVRHVVEMAHDEDILVIMDCDDTHDPALIREMLKSIEEGADVVIGSRFVRGALVRSVPRLRRLTALTAAALFKLIHPVSGVRDYTCGYRTYRVSVLKSASNSYGTKLIEESGFSCMPELLLKLNALGFHFSEVPLQLRYDQKPTASKMGVRTNISEILKLLVHSRLHGFNPSPGVIRCKN